MNTNSKHYEILAIEPWEIMEKNFTTEEFVAYLKGNIIKYTLRDKGQDLSDAEKIKHYAEKLIKVLETKENDKDNWTITGVKLEKPKPVEEPEVKHKFKVGDRVVLYKDSPSRMTGTVVRVPTKGYCFEDSYIVKRDDKGASWRANLKADGVDCSKAWGAKEKYMELLETEPKKTLEPNKWYDAKDFTIEELKELLPVGTVVTVTEEHDDNRTVDLEEETLLSTTVRNIGQRWEFKDTRVGITGDIYWRRYFKIIE